MHAAVLRYLDQVARLGSIRRAAAVLNVASSAVNRQILKLEEELGTPLFERRRTGVRPTAAGERLLHHVRETLSEYQRTRAEIAGLSGEIRGEVRLISIRPLVDRFLPRIIQAVMKRHPHITVHVTGFDPAETGEAADLGSYDLGIVFTEGRARDDLVLAQFHTPFGAIMPRDHPLARQAKVTLEDCTDHPVLILDDLWFRQTMSETRFAARGGRLAPRIVANSLPLIVNALKAGLGIGLFTPIGFLEELRAGELAFVPLADARFEDSEVSLISPRHKRLSPPARVVADHLAAAFDGMRQTLAEVATASA
jgi:DNA-binding transcriptional LysR family regulator